MRIKNLRERRRNTPKILILQTKSENGKKLLNPPLLHGFSRSGVYG